MLLYGPPGTGKTLLAQAIAKESGSFFLNLSGNDFAISLAQEFGNEKGLSSEEKIKTVFNIAIQEADGKTIVALIDEIDQMGGGFRSVGRELQNILDDPRYKNNIVIIATTNWLDRLSSALLRPGRISKKELVSYPEGKELLQIIEKVLDDYYDEKAQDVPELFSNLNKEGFREKFARKIYKEMNQSKYEIKYGDMGVKPGDKLNPEDGRVLFTGADAWKVITEEAPSITVMNGRRTLQETDFVEAIGKVYKYNRANRQWISNARQFIFSEIDASKDQEDDRKKRDGPMDPQF